MATIFDLSQDDFFFALDELGLPPEQRDELIRQYRSQNSVLAPLNRAADESQAAIAGEGRRPVAGGLLSKPEGATGIDALRGLRLEPMNAILGMLTGTLQPLEAPAAAAANLIPADDMAGEGFATAAATMGLGGLLSGPRGLLDYDPSETRIFLGPRSSGADLDALTRARDLSARRRSPDEIWEQTGWFKGADGNWRYEIDDSRAVLRQPAAGALNYDGPGYQTNYSGGVLHQPLLGGTYRGVEYKPAYDFMGDMDFSRENSPRGSFDRDTSRIAVAGPSARDGLPVALHELQHAVQRQEGFAGGSNPGFEMSELLAERAAERTNLSRLIDETQSALGLSGYRPQHQDLLPLYERYDELLNRAIPSDQAYQRYLRVAGEVEANNVMNRLRMTAGERRATPPWVTQDFPYGEQIVRSQRGILDFSDRPAPSPRNGQ